jgi:hypothetical protein
VEVDIELLPGFVKRANSRSGGASVRMLPS